MGWQRMSVATAIWMGFTGVSAVLFGMLCHSWAMSGLGATLPSLFTFLFYAAVHGEMLGAELLLRVIGAVFTILFEAMG